MTATGRGRAGPAAGTFAEALSAAVDALTAAGVDSPRLEAELLLCAAAAVTREELAAEPEALLDARAGREFGATVRRRLRREPIAYILGRRAFRYLELHTDIRALIPRPETELLVEVALAERPGSVLDVGTGSGAVAVAIASELPECRVLGTDVSADALALARENAIRIGVADRVEFELGSVPAGRRFDVVVANLPYVPEGDWERLEPDITAYEPPGALIGGVDGLDVVRAVAAELASAGSPGAAAGNPGAAAPVVALEIGEGQAGATREILAAAGWPATESRRDLAGIERVVIGRRSAPPAP